MKGEELRTIQAPLKERYRDDPDAAVVTLSADGKLGEGVSCSVRTGQAIAGLHPAVATSLGIEVESGTVRADGDLDSRGTLSTTLQTAQAL